MNTVHAPSNDANTPPEVPAEGTPVFVMTSDDAFALLQTLTTDADKMAIVQWMTGLRSAWLHELEAEA